MERNFDEFLEQQEDKLLEEWDREFNLWIKNWPALLAYNEFVSKNKRNLWFQE